MWSKWILEGPVVEELPLVDAADEEPVVDPAVEPVAVEEVELL
jgi:hypothetical protein